MNKIKIASGYPICLIIAIAFCIVSCSGDIVNDVKSRYNSEFREVANNADWFININNKHKITRKSIEGDREFLVKWFSNPEEVKKKLADKKLKGIYLEKTLNQNLIIIKALEDGILDTDEFDKFLWINIRDNIVHYYLKKKLTEKNPNFSKIKINHNEVEDLYKKYKCTYEAMGLSKQKAISNIRDTITKQKIALILQKFENSTLNELKLKNKIEFAK